jgi:OOP family OmpA-OmpF porin
MAITMKATRILVLSSVFISTYVGCGPRSNPSLERAELNLREAKNNSELVSRAPTLINEASDNLDKAQRVWRDDRDRDQVEHLVYLSERKLEIAREEARRKESLSDADRNRDKARAAALDLRISASEANARARANDTAERRYQAESATNRRLIQDLRDQVSAIQSAETERGLILTLSDDIFFESGSAQLKSGSKLKLSSIAEFLRAHPARSIIVEGHTDSVGTAQSNRELSQQRADAVRTQLVIEGVDGQQVRSVGLGQEFPIASNKSEAGRLQNRRVQIVIPNQDA